MGATGFVVKWIAKTLGGAVKVPVDEHGVMFPHVFSYKDKIADLATETEKVSQQYLEELIAEAHQKHDLNGLRVIYTYMIDKGYSNKLIIQLIKYAREAKLLEWAHRKWPDPFAMLDHIHHTVEKVVSNLC